jgi:hypothetical protein
MRVGNGVWPMGGAGGLGWKLGKGAGRGGEGVTLPAWELGKGDGRGCGDGMGLEGTEIGEVGGELGAGKHRVNHTLFGGGGGRGPGGGLKTRVPAWVETTLTRLIVVI